MAPVIHILLTLTYVVLGECSLNLIARQLLGLSPSVGPLLPQLTPAWILESLLHHDHPKPFHNKGVEINTHNINSNKNYNPSWANTYSGLNPLFPPGPFYAGGLNPPSVLDVYPGYTAGDKTLIQDVVLLPSEQNTDSNKEVPNADSNIIGIQEPLPPKTNVIQSPDNRQEIETRPENFNQGQSFMLASPNNNVILLQENSKTNSPDIIAVPINANPPTNNVISPPNKNSQVYALINGKIVPTSVAETNQNIPYSSTQMKLPAVNQSPGYILVYSNADSNYEQENSGQGQSGQRDQNVPIASPHPGENTVYIALPNQGQYVFSGQVPNVITIPNNQADNGNDYNFVHNKQEIVANPNCCHNEEKTNTETKIIKESDRANITENNSDVADNLSKNQLPVITAQNVQPTLIVTHKVVADKNTPKD